MSGDKAARDSAPVGEANANPDLVEGIARAICVATQGAAYQVDGDQIILTLGTFEAPVFVGTKAECDSYLDELRTRAALEYISSLGMVVVPSSALTPRDAINREVLETLKGLLRAIDEDDVGGIVEGWMERADRAIAKAEQAAGPVGEANNALSPRDERAVTDDGLREALEKISAMQWQDRSTVSELNAWPAFVKANARAVEIFGIADEALSKDRGEAP